MNLPHLPHANGRGIRVPGWLIGAIGAAAVLIMLGYNLAIMRQDDITRSKANAEAIVRNNDRINDLRAEMNRALGEINFRLCRMEAASPRVPNYQSCEGITHPGPLVPP